jgi:hypothetical protein
VVVVMAREMLGAGHCGLKRRAEDEADGDQPITKRLARMRIGEEKKEVFREAALIYYPDQPHFQPSISSPEPVLNGHSTDDDRMYLDDTKDKIYIHDLESEIAQIEAEEPKGIFLPDIDRKISAIPQRLLLNRTNNANTQMVLYHVPSSISVPEEQDHVRKAIIAARARAREKQVREVQQNQKDDKVAQYQGFVNGLNTDRAVSDGMGYEQEEDDPDAMELG